MNTSDINKLLEKYFDAETSSAEEGILKEYFSGEVAPELEKYKSYFVFLIKENDVKYPEKVKESRFGYFKYAAAAVILITASVSGFYINKQMEAEREMEQTREALLTLAVILNESNKQIQKCNLIQDNIMSLKKLEKYEISPNLLLKKGEHDNEEKY